MSCDLKRKAPASYTEPKVKRKKKEKKVVPRHACPFFKKDPFRFRDCYGWDGAPLDRPADLRQHLIRRHKICVCPKCFRAFADDDKDAKLKEHIRNRTPDCVEVGNPYLGLGANIEQIDKIKGLVKKGKVTPEAGWNVTWKILFEEDNTAPPEASFVDPREYMRILPVFLESFARFRASPQFRPGAGSSSEIGSEGCCMKTLRVVEAFVGGLLEQEQQQFPVGGPSGNNTSPPAAAPPTCDPSQLGLGYLQNHDTPGQGGRVIPVDPSLEGSVLTEDQSDHSFSSWVNDNGI